jgi:hypothetical protein
MITKRAPAAGKATLQSWEESMTWSRASTVVMGLVSVMLLAMHDNVLALICGGFFLTGLGEWINNPTTTVSRKSNWLGVLLEVAGGILMISGAYLEFTSR